MFDVAIIGGGLAGCYAAITLAKRDHQVLLLESGTYPRHKVCGEFLSPESIALFQDAGFLPSLLALKPVEIHRLRITAPDGTIWRTEFPVPAIGVSRYALDEALFLYCKQLGANAIENAHVTEIEGNLHDGFTLSVRMKDGMNTFYTKALISAHGKHSNLDRTLNRDFLHQDRSYVGLKCHFSGPPLPDKIDLHVFPGGYCGMSEVENDVTNVCLLVKQKTFREKEGDVEQFIAWMCEQNGHLGRWLSGATSLYDDWLTIGQIPLNPKTPLEGDILLAGDAAGMVAPLAGDGMVMALQSGKLAAQFIDRYLTDWHPAEDIKRDYAREWGRHFHSRLRLGRALQEIILHPKILGLGLKALNALPPLGDFIVKQTRDLSLLERKR